MDVSPFLAKILNARGLNEPKEIEKYLFPDLERDWQNPYDISGMEQLANRVEKSLRDGDRILIYGDYDLDGISATAIMLRGLKAIDKHINAGMTVDYFLPSRFNEGYGFSEKSLERLLKLEDKPDIIITVDCGITAGKEIAELKKNDIDVVVTDHHAKSENYPEDTIIVDPEANDQNSEDANLSGAGVALKLICVLGGRFGLPYLWQEYIDLATLGTLADYMPLIGQNRALVKEGIKYINDNPRVAIRALLACAGKQAGDLSTTDIAYIITPRLNASGRLDHANLAVDLLLNDDYSFCYLLSLQIEACNNERRSLTDVVVSQANYRAKKALQNSPDLRCLVLSSKEWHPGVIGIAAAKIAETYNLPTIIFTDDGEICKGSGRSVGQVDLHEACLKSYDKFVKFGGHKSACGATILSDDIGDFRLKLNSYLNNIDKSLFSQAQAADLEIGLHELTIDNIKQLDFMEPFGNQNEPVVFLSKNIFINKAKAVGADRNHLSCNLTDGVYGAQGIMFNVPDIDKYLKIDSTMNAIYNAKIEEFQNKFYVKMHLKQLVSTCVQNNVIDDDKNAKFLTGLYESQDNCSMQDNSVGDFIANSVYEQQKDIIEGNNFNNNNSDIFERENTMDVDFDNLQQKIIDAMIGPGARLHDSQNDTLNLLKDGNSVLSVMPTGRGKSLIFQVYASVLALSQKKMSIFVYPLRALIADQAFHLQKNLSDFNLAIRVLNGETPQDDRVDIYNLISENKLDIMLTTPEFLAMHIDKLKEIADVGFVVVDEAHHLGGVKIGDRSAYGHMPKILEELGNPQVLALSATVSDKICAEIQEYLPVKHIVKDNFERANLYVDDRRNVKCRDDYLINICASGQKTVIYVNSRQQTVDLARMIKSRAPHIAMKVGFYNAGMTKDDRKKIEQMFRNNELCVLVATSAFGEGVNIPDIRHVCLYHLPFSNVEFNQMAGRCGRDNNDAIVHLLYNRADATINTQILTAANPDRNELGKIYIWLKGMCSNAGGCIQIKNDDLLKMEQSKTIPSCASALLCAFNIFDELGLIELETFMKDGSNYSKIAMSDVADKVDLETSTRFCEGQNELLSFEDYRHTAMRKTTDELQKLLRHPILPVEL